MRVQTAINLGYEIAALKLNADKCKYIDKVNVSDYGQFAFSVYYPTHIFNATSFLFRNKLNPLKGNRPYRLLFGGQATWTNPDLLSEIADEVFVGEVDGNYVDRKGVHRAKEIDSPIIMHNDIGSLEISRGCQHRCTFCEYGNVCGGKYREKPLELIREQIAYAKSRNAKRLVFFAANMPSHSRFEEILQYSQESYLDIINFGLDAYVTDMDKIFKWLSVFKNKQIKLAVESFDEKTRFNVGKKYTDEQLLSVINRLIEHGIHNINFLLIYGLPYDDYNSWFKWIEILGKIRKSHTIQQPNLFGEQIQVKSFPLRFETTVQNLEPCKGTPLENIVLDFDQKDKFITDWQLCLKHNGMMTENATMGLEHARGRLGRKPAHYKLIMMLRKGGGELTDILINCFPYGVSRSIRIDDTNRFWDMVGKLNGSSL